MPFKLPMKLSVIIVNYNVKFFLEQCLLSVRKAASQLKSRNPGYETEVIVVDNNSVDSSVKMLQSRFKDIQLVLNKENKGFSAANNQAIKIARGDYILLLNPDTVVEEFTFQKILEFAESKPDAGAIGVKMIDGKGYFLPESKRGLPTPSIAFYKIFGLSRFFPKSRVFGKYHLGYLDKDQVHEVDVIAGAFMLVHKDVLEKAGLLDESFFMYGEDIDISYRIKQAGYKNYYFPGTQIIHYKGESTKKSSVNYVFIFYRAMIIFAKKHFAPRKASFFSFLINLAIYFRASLSIAKRFLQRIFLPILDIITLFAGLYLVKFFWESNQVIGHGSDYPAELLAYIFPLYILLWMLGLLLSKCYSTPFSIIKISRGIFIGSVLIIVVYAFLEESHRFSRALIILGTVSSFIAAFINRLIYNYLKYKDLKFKRELCLGIVGSSAETERVFNLLKDSNLEFNFVGFVSSTTDNNFKPEMYIGHIDQLDEIIEIYHLNELIFCSKDVSSHHIINTMTRIRHRNLLYKIAPEETLFVIGSHNKNEPGDYYTINIKLSIDTTANRFSKRLLDIFLALFFMLSSPILILFQHNGAGFVRNLFSILTGKKTWVGYFSDEGNICLPQLRTCVVHCAQKNNGHDKDNFKPGEINFIYARDYDPILDIWLVFKKIRHLGGN
jgi:O-antigen biosynthesis protein